MNNLSPQRLKDISDKVKNAVDDYSVQSLTGEHRDHLGASVIGMECHRAIWYAWRWVKFEIFSGRMLRLFERGTLEEQRFIKLLRGIGTTVWEVNPATGKQFRIYGCSGHFGGSGDSVGILPQLPNEPVLLEFKTHNLKSFLYLINNGVKKAKPQHYSQMCKYGEYYKFKYGLYCAVNKNDDDLWFELVELDWRLAHDLENKAADIIQAKIPPNRISDQPSYFTCKYCNFADICHNNTPVEINCRSCKMCIPIENAEWKCIRYNQVIPPEFIKKGCQYHVSINE
jgi:hypothetical protein